ncbi:MAG: hypothetical protein AUH96_04980 [Nitrospirae bacterium 13_2_20CM_2_61_4]|nr:MAG: hypothetical protein AUH96_04980 [Nitrospirae bacterium 13_2_20CM_2_61_4]
MAAESRAEVVREVNQTIPDNDPTGLADSVTFGSEFANFAVEHVEVEFTATHPYRGDLEVTLTSPSGVMSRLATVRNRDFSADFSSWPFSSVRHWGEGAAGTWTLRVTDGVVGDEGTWTAWKLRIFGTRN